MPDSISALTEIKISELPEAAQANATDLLEASQAEGTQFVSRKISLDQVSTVVAGSDQVQAEIDSAIAALPPPVSDWNDITGKPATFPPTVPIPYSNISGTPVVTVPVGTIAFGGVGGALTGNSTLAWDNTNKAFAITGYSGSGSAFFASGAVPASPASDVFRMDITNPSSNAGNIFRLRSGPTSGSLLDAFKVDMAGDAAMSGSCQALASSGLVAGGAIYFGYFLGNFTGGTLGLWGGSGAPTFNSGGKYGGLYLNGASPGIPYYNNNGAAGWDRLVGETSTQTLTNKTLAPASISPGTNGQVLTTVSGAAAWAAVPSPPGSLLQTVTFQTGAVATGTTIIPLDDTIPQITEGDEYMTLVITPRSATSKLLIDVVLQITSSVVNNLAAALFQDSTANALCAAIVVNDNANAQYQLALRHNMTSGTTAATTFRVRAGGGTAGTTTINGTGGSRRYGGVLASSIVIQEVT